MPTGAAAVRDPLDVWLYGTHLATVSERREGRLELTWTGAATDRWGVGAGVLSAMLRIGTDPPPPLVTAYLDGLLPEGNARVNAAFGAGVAPDDTYALVRAYGRDTPGAAIFVPSGSPDPSREGRLLPLAPADVAHRVRLADVRHPAAPGRGTDSSTLPGMVPKITLHRDGRQWFACVDGAASTWILKRGDSPGSPLADVIDTEVACLDLARTIGLTSIEAEIVDFGDVRAIAVSRYDRDASVPGHRIHQEDLAQALGLNTQDPNRKFQWGSSIPSLGRAADVLLLDGGDPDDLLRLVTFSFLVGNTDLHAKNISFLRHPDGRVELSPAYDIAMHLHHPRSTRRFALDLAGRHLMDELTVRDVIAEGRRWRLSEARATRVVGATVEAVQEALARVDRARHRGVPPEAWEVIDDRVRAAWRLMPSGGRQTRPVHSGERPRRRGPRRPR